MLIVSYRNVIKTFCSVCNLYLRFPYTYHTIGDFPVTDHLYFIPYVITLSNINQKWFPFFSFALTTSDSLVDVKHRALLKNVLYLVDFQSTPVLLYVVEITSVICVVHYTSVIIHPSSACFTLKSLFSLSVCIWVFFRTRIVLIVRDTLPLSLRSTMMWLGTPRYLTCGFALMLRHTVSSVLLNWR